MIDFDPFSEEDVIEESKPQEEQSTTPEPVNPEPVDAPEFDPFEEIEQEQRRAAMALDGDSQRAAESRELSTRFQVSRTAADIKHDDFKKQAEKDDVQSMLGDTPFLASWLAQNPHDAPIFKNDLGVIKEVEEGFRKVGHLIEVDPYQKTDWDETHGDYLGIYETEGMEDPENSTGNAELDHDIFMRRRPEIIAPVYRSAKAGIEAGYLQGEKGVLYHRAMMGEVDMDESFKRKSQELDEAIQKATGTYGDDFAYSAAQILGTMGSAFKNSGQGATVGAALGTMGAMATASAGTGPFAGLTFAGLASLSLATGLTDSTLKIEGGLAYADMIKANTDPVKARRIAMGVGAVNSIVEMLGLHYLGEAAKPILKAGISRRVGKTAEALEDPSFVRALGQVGKAYSVGVGQEVVTEVMQEGVNIAGEEIARMWADGQQDPATVDAVVDRLVDIAVQTTKGAAVLGLAGLSAGATIQAKRVMQAQDTQLFFEKLNDAIPKMNAKNLSPDAVHEYIAAQASESGNATTYIDAGEFHQAMIDTGVTVDELRQVLPDVADKIEQAAVNGSDIEISTADYATKLAGTKLGGQLTQSVRLSPDALSARDAIKVQQAFEAMRKELVKGTFDSKAAGDRFVANITNKKYREKQADLERRYVEDLKALTVEKGNFNEQEAHIQARLASGMIVNLAQRANIPVERIDSIAPKLAMKHQVKEDEFHMPVTQGRRWLYGDRASKYPNRKVLITDVSRVERVGRISNAVGVALDKYKLDPNESPSEASSEQRLENEDTGWTMTINGGDRREIVSASTKRGVQEATLAAVVNLHQIVKNAVLAESYRDVKAIQGVKGVDPNLRGMHRFYAPMRLDGESYLVKITVKDKSGDKGPKKGTSEDRLGIYQIVGLDVIETKQNARSTTVDERSENSNPVRPDGRSSHQGTEHSQLRDPHSWSHEISVEDMLRGVNRDGDAFYVKNENDGRFEKKVRSMFFINEPHPDAFGESGGYYNTPDDLRGASELEQSDVFNQSSTRTKKTIQIVPSNQWRVLKRTLDNMTPQERVVFDEFIDSRVDSKRIRSNLNRLKDTPWATQAIEAVFVRAAILDLLEGREPRVQSMLDNPQLASSKKKLKSGEAGLWELMLKNGFVGDASKPAHNVNSSFLNCNPSNDCAKFCYATQGNYKYAASVVKSELVSEAIARDPIKAAQMTASQYKTMAEFHQSKALRLFDKGDGDKTWLPYIEELNRQGVRVQIFSKRPDFLINVSDFNLRLLSIDESNKEMAEQYKDLPVAFVYSSETQIPKILDLHNQGRIQVVLPVKEGKNLLDKQKVDALRKQDKTVSKHICPIDAGWQTIKTKKNPDGWNCTMCDKNGGCGCFHGSVTKAVMEAAVNAERRNIKMQDMSVTQLMLEIEQTKRELDEALRNLGQDRQLSDRTDGERAPVRVDDGGAGAADVSRRLDELLQELFARINTGATGDGGAGVVGSTGGILPNVQKRRTGMESSNGDSNGRGSNDVNGSFMQGANGVGQGVGELAGRGDGKLKGDFLQSEKYRGSFSSSHNVITLTPNADLSTFAHEMSHWYLDMLFKLAGEKGVSETILEDVNTLLKEFGVESLEAWRAMSVDDQRKHHETFAAWTETYLAEGKAPTQKLERLLARFADWLKAVYKQFRDPRDEIAANYKHQFGTELPPISDEVRRVLDRMIASDEALEQAQSAHSLKPLFDQKPDDMSDEEWKEMMLARDEAEQRGVEAIAQARAKDERWYHRARSKKLAEIQKKGEELKKSLREKISRKINGLPGVVALDLLKKGGSLGVETMKLDPDALWVLGFSEKKIATLRSLGALKKGTLGKQIAKMRKQGMSDVKIREALKIQAEQQISASRELLRPFARFNSNEKMIEAIVTAGDRDQMIEDEVTRQAMAQHSEWFDEKKREEIVTRALHNEARARLVATELKYLMNDREGNSRIYREAARMVAAEMVAKMPMKAVNWKNFVAAESRASRKAYECIKKGDRMGAVLAKRQQLVQHEAVAIAMGIEKKAAALKATKKLVFGSDKKIAKSMDIDIVGVVRYILTNNGYGRVAPSENDPTVADKHIKHLGSLDEARKAFFQGYVDKYQYRGGNVASGDLTVEAFETLADDVAQLVGLAKEAKKMRVKGKRENLENVINELLEQTEKVDRKRFMPGRESQVRPNEKATFSVLWWETQLLRVETWCRMMDGGQEGPFTKYIYRPVAEAAAKYRVENSKLQKKLVELIRERQESWAKQGSIDAHEIGYEFKTKQELIGALLHTGNQSNLEKLLLGGRGKGKRWAELVELPNGAKVMLTDRWDAFIARCYQEGIITKEDMDFCQAVWDLLESTKPAAQKAFKDLYGYNFVEVEATQITTPFGVYRGGYVPAITTKFLVAEASTHQEIERITSNDYITMMPVTTPGFSKTRSRDYTEPLLFDISLLCGHVSKVLKFSYIAPAVYEVGKVITDRQFARVLFELNPHFVDAMLKPWLKRAYTQSVSTGESNWLDQKLNKLRSIAGMNIMAGHLLNALQQWTGLTVAMAKVSPKSIAKAAALISSGNVTIKDIIAKSSTIGSRLADRAIEYESEIARIASGENDRVKNAEGKYDKLYAIYAKGQPARDWISQHGYFFQTVMQAPIDCIVWLAAYNEACARGLSDADAVAEADSVVRTTQSDFSPENIAGIEAGSALYRAFLVFYNYFGMQANLLAESWVTKDYGVFARDAMMIVYIPSIISAIIANMGFDFDDDDDVDAYDVLHLLIAEPFKNVMAMIPLLGSAAATGLQNAAASDVAVVGDIGRFLYGEDPYAGRLFSSPAIDLIASSYRGAGDLIDIIAGEEVDARRATRNILDLVTLVTGISMGAIKRPAGYLAGVAAGDYSAENPAEIAKGLVTGKGDE